jgi:hypothetical protein
MRNFLRFCCFHVFSSWAVIRDSSFVKPPRQKKLIDLKSQRTGFTLQCPRGGSFRLLLGVPEAKVDWGKPNPKVPKAPPFRGQVTITQNSKQVCSFPISSDKTNRSNCLDQHGLEGGYILDTGPVAKGQDFGQPLDYSVAKLTKF